MAISNYLELKQAIERWAKRGDIASLTDDFIDLAESDIWQHLRIRDMEARATAVTGADRFLALPDGFLEMRKLTLVSGSLRYDLTSVVPESLKLQGTSGIPSSFTVTSQLEFNRIPAGNYTAEMQYYKTLTPLSTTDPVNAVLTRFPSIYLYGALFHFAQWAHNDAMLQKYVALFSKEIELANKSDRRGRYGPAPAMRIEGSTP
jgi:hypothetical protein